GPRVPSLREAILRSASVMGAPSTRKMGITMVRIMWLTIWAENSTRPKMAGALEESQTRIASPTKKKIVRATGHLSPRSASFLSARRYQTAKKIATATHSQLNRHSVIHRIAVSSGGNSYLVVIRAGDASGGISSGFGGSEL